MHDYILISDRLHGEVTNGMHSLAVHAALIPYR
jgi:hypothetical protein